MPSRLPRPLRALLLSAIRAYQRHLSPHKGFCCAYRALTGRDSCSAYAYRAIARHGSLTGLRLLSRRLDVCSGTWHARQAGPGAPARRPGVSSLKRQRGSCDLPCDAPDTDCCGNLCDAYDCKDHWRTLRRAFSRWRARRRRPDPPPPAPPQNPD